MVRDICFGNAQRYLNLGTEAAGKTASAPAGSQSLGTV